MRWAALSILLIAAACSSTAATTTTTAGEPVAERLVVLTSENKLSVMDPDGSDAVTIVDGSDRLVIQPTWSPGGDRLAWTEIVLAGGPETVAVVTGLPDGSDRTRTAVANPPFYLSWSPQGDRLLLLRNGALELEVGLIDVAAGGGSESVVATGQPFYFAWSPDGSEIIANIGVADRLEVIDVDGDEVTSPLGVALAQFQAPGWVGDRQFWARSDGPSASVVVTDLAEAATTVLASYQGFVHFLPSPDGERVAYRVLDQAPPAVTVGLSAQASAEPGELKVVDVDSGDEISVSTDNPLAFFWSPDSSKLLFLSVATDGFTWSVWDGESVTDYETFTPSRSFGRDYLPFFDQFAQSIEVWAPDGESFVYSGRTLTEPEPGIWVQPLDGPARRVADGVFAAFMPAQ